MRYGLLSVLLLVCIVGLPCFGQVDRADLEGTVTDSSGGGVSGAKITITANATGIEDERTTNQYGYYHFPSIALGLYSVVANHDGFKVKIIENVNLQVGDTRTLDIELELGTREETITVEAQAEPYERSTAESSIVIGQEQIDNLPTNGRNWSTLTILAP